MIKPYLPAFGRPAHMRNTPIIPPPRKIRREAPVARALSPHISPPASPPAPASPSLEECIICMDAPPETVFYKCGHICACKGCARGMKGMPCPLCRQTVLDVIEVFHA